MAIKTRKLTLTGLTSTQARIITESSKLCVASKNGLVCRKTLQKNVNIPSAMLSNYVTQLRKSDAFPFEFSYSTRGRKRENLSVTVKVPA